MTIYECLKQMKEHTDANHLLPQNSKALQEDNRRLIGACERLMVAIDFYGAMTEENIHTGEVARLAAAAAKDVLNGYDPNWIPGN